MFIKNFRFPGFDTEEEALEDYTRYESTYYQHNLYPFKTIVPKVAGFVFEPVTILYGSNGSGKSTALNTIANKIKAKRYSAYNNTYWMDKFVNLCSYELDEETAERKFGPSGRIELFLDENIPLKLITSDDVFKYMQEKRLENEAKLAECEKIKEERRNVGHITLQESGVSRHLDFETGEGIQEFMKFHALKKKSLGSYLSSTLGDLEEGMSNGENALQYLVDHIKDGGLYLLDEPENSMASEFQVRLANYISYAARFSNCQFIIATHSPFILSMPYAKVYNLDLDQAKAQNWWELENMRTLGRLFIKNQDKFQFDDLDE